MKNSLNKIISSGAIVAACAASSTVIAAEYNVTVTNLTRGIYFTPLLVAAHADSARIFTSGQKASASLQAMAEGGDISGLVSDLSGLNATLIENPAAGLLGPGESTNASVDTLDNTANNSLSVVAMMLPTNDGFIGLNAVSLPTVIGQSMQYNVSAYDAGTEANDELRGSGAPGAPGFPAPGPVDGDSGNNGTGIAAEIEDYVLIHRGVLGDHSATDGVSDIDSTVHRWLNPVARVTIELINE
jgi:hypothetical protein